MFLAALRTLKEPLLPSRVITHQSPIVQCIFMKDLPNGPHELGLAGRQVGPCPAEHSAELQGLYSSGCSGPCQLKIGLTGD